MCNIEYFPIKLFSTHSNSVGKLFQSSSSSSSNPLGTALIQHFITTSKCFPKRSLKGQCSRENIGTVSRESIRTVYRESIGTVSRESTATVSSENIYDFLSIQTDMLCFHSNQKQFHFDGRDVLKIEAIRFHFLVTLCF